jgi:beta-lactamase regulating signal transducer with metallopeptidase domain
VLLKLITPPLILLPVLVAPTRPAPPPVPVPADPIPASAATIEPDMEPAGTVEPAATADPPALRNPNHEPRTTDFPWRAVVIGVWLAGSLGWWALAVVRLRRFGRVLRVARPAPAEVQHRARELAGQLGLRRCPGVWFVPVPVPPLVWAVFGRARVLVPAALWDGLSEGQRDALLLHELAHLRRGDHWVRRLELLVLGLYWWLPVAWLARRALESAEERSCDAWVVWARPTAAPDYALALLRTVEFLAGTVARPAAASAAGPVHDLKRRLTMILKETPSRSPVRAWWVVALGVLALPWLPTWAQTRTEPSAPGQPPAAGPLPAAVNEYRARFDTTLRNPAASSDRLTVTADGPNNRPTAPPSDPQPFLNSRRANLIADAKDAVELAAAELNVKKAELRAAEVVAESARNQLARFERLRDNGTVAATELEQARTAAASAQAAVAVKQAELQQSEVRLRQAHRRLEALTPPAAANPSAPKPPPMPFDPNDPNRPTRSRPVTPPAANDLFSDQAVQVAIPPGSTHRALVMLKNTSSQAVRIGTVRTTGSYLKATARPETAAPGESIGVEITVDGTRISGTKQGDVFVSFAEPAGKEIRIGVRAVVEGEAGHTTTSSTTTGPFGSSTTTGTSGVPAYPAGNKSTSSATSNPFGSSTTTGSTNSAPAEDRIKAMERKLADMQKELEELRRSRPAGPGGSRP